MASLDQFGQGDDPTAYRRALALQLMSHGLDTSPVRSPWQGAARLAQALVGSMWQGQNSADQRAAAAQLSSLLSPDTTAPPPVPSAPIQSSPLPAPTGVPDSGTTRGMRNNNPGNIEDGPFAKRLPGYAGTDGRFAKFASLDNGMGAIDSLLQNYGQEGINTVGGIINRWAPPTDNNPTPAYAATVAKALGTTPDAPVDLSDPSIRQKIAAGIGRFENGTAFTPPQIAGAPTAAQPQAAPPDIKSKIAALLSSDNPYAQQIGQRLAMSAIAPSLQPPQVMKIQNRDGSESIVFTSPSQMQVFGAGGRPLNADQISGGTPHPELSGNDYASFLQKNEPGKFNLINGMLTGRIAPATLGRYGTKQVQALLEDAARIEPGFDMSKWTGRVKTIAELGSGQPNSMGGKTQALKNSLEHLGNTAEAIADKGNYDLGTPILSAPANYLTSQTTGQQGAANKIDTEARIYGGERTKFLTGRGGTEEERTAFAHKLGPNTAAPAASAGAIEGEYAQLKDAIENHKRQLRDQLGERAYKELLPTLDAEIEKHYKRIDAQISRLRGNGDTSAAPATTAGVPAGVDPILWQHMTPQERALWKK